MCYENRSREDWRRWHRYEPDGPGPHRGEPCYEDSSHLYRPSNMIGPFPRHFLNNKEFLEFLEEYRQQLLNELEGVEEAIAELRQVISETEAPKRDKDN